MSFPLQYHRYIEIAVKQCRSSGIDCKIHGLGIVGRIRAEDEDLATVPFLASDNEEEDDDKTATGRYDGPGNEYFSAGLSTFGVVEVFVIFSKHESGRRFQLYFCVNFYRLINQPVN